MKKIISILFVTLIGGSLLTSCKKEMKSNNKHFLWENANVYFLLTDRFNNGDTSNDLNFDRTENTAKLRGFKGGDLKGITAKIKEGYFTKLGIDAIWFSPVVEQVHGVVDEGTGNTYPFHGYWAKDWTALEPNFGTKADLKELVEVAHAHGIRLVLDVVINHTGPATVKDPCWPNEWVRTSPKCEYKDYKTTIQGPLVANLPDIRTDSDIEVELPQVLVDKWKKEGRYEQEKKELDEFFARTGLPRAPRFYIMKWIVDFIKDYGIDAFRVDTVKHVEENIWSELWKEAVKAFEDWKTANPDKKLDDNEFFMVGEVYGYNVANDRIYDFGDKKVDYFDHGFKSLINFGFKYDINKSYEELFSYYSNKLNSKALENKSVMNYISSHDDASPYDKKREKSILAGTKLLLCPGSSQIYYGDETSRRLDHVANGDACLRSFMNWDEMKNNVVRNGVKVNDVLTHYQKLGTFRRDHPAVGAGVHTMISQNPYVFKREYKSTKFSDKVVVALDVEKGAKVIDIKGTFDNGSTLKDYYSGKSVKVLDGKVKIDTKFDIVLLAM